MSRSNDEFVTDMLNFNSKKQDKLLQKRMEVAE